MEGGFQTVSTPGFERDVRSAVRRNPLLLTAIERILDTLEEDPYNSSRSHSIKKLSGVKTGSGSWRIRQGKYRLRYDIIGHDVILYSFRHRKEGYK